MVDLLLTIGLALFGYALFQMNRELETLRYRTNKLDEDTLELAYWAYGHEYKNKNFTAKHKR